MPVYNGETYLRETLDSILAQTFPDFEAVIIDDCSTDGSLVIMREYARKDSRVKVFHNETNVGLTKSLNKAIGLSSGIYVARLDAGDTSEKDRFAKQVAFLNNHPDYGLVGSWATIIDERSEKIGQMAWNETDADIRKALIKHNPIIHSSIMIRRSVLEKIGGYNEAWKYAQDYELYFQIIKYSKVANLPEFLISYRAMSGSITLRKNKRQAFLAIRSRWNAVRAGQYPWWAVIYLARPLFGLLLPRSVKKMLKSFT